MLSFRSDPTTEILMCKQNIVEHLCLSEYCIVLLVIITFLFNSSFIFNVFFLGKLKKEIRHYFILLVLDFYFLYKKQNF